MLTTPYTVVYEDHQMQLCQYQSGTKGAVLICPPQAGHTSLGIADYGDEGAGRSLVYCAMQTSPEGTAVFVINFKGATMARKHETYDDMAFVVMKALELIYGATGCKSHLVGLCQGGVLSTVVAAIVPDMVTKLTIAGAPIDSEACESDITDAIAQPMEMYEWMVNIGITPFKRGLMSGDDMLMAWKSMNWYEHYVNRYVKLWAGDRAGERLYKWYDETQDISGPAYLFMIGEIFKGNKLIKNELVVLGTLIVLDNIECDVHIISGLKDTITPPDQCKALGLAVSPKAKVTYHYAPGGHLGVFNGKQAIANQWPLIFKG